MSPLRSFQAKLKSMRAEIFKIEGKLGFCSRAARSLGDYGIDESNGGAPVVVAQTKPSAQPDDNLSLEQAAQMGKAKCLRDEKADSRARRMQTQVSGVDGMQKQGGQKNSSGKFDKAKLLAKLSGARFRFLNEMLYSETGATSFQKFGEDPDLFDVYHQGFRSQVKRDVVQYTLPQECSGPIR
eukprot:SAG31_NODE_3382_length_4335_cov_2.871813_2_plen_183_part_00